MQVSLTNSFPLCESRLHEACGPGAFGFAGVACTQAVSDVLWVRESWRSEAINPVGLGLFIDPKRLLVAKAGTHVDALAVAEEALRDGAVPLVVVELSQPLTLRTSRRLQLSAKAGKATGLCLIPEGMGSNAAETRWHCTPLYDPQGVDSTLMRWRIIKNKTGTTGAWDVRWDHAARRLDVVSPPRERQGAEGAAD
jgi:protein ImuA